MHLIRSGTTLIWDYVLGPCDGLKSPVEVGNRFHCSLNNPKAAFGAGFPFSIALERPVSGPIELRICTDQVHKLETNPINYKNHDIFRTLILILKPTSAY